MESLAAALADMTEEEREGIAAMGPGFPQRSRIESAIAELERIRADRLKSAAWNARPEAALRRTSLESAINLLKFCLTITYFEIA